MNIDNGNLIAKALDIIKVSFHGIDNEIYRFPSKNLFDIDATVFVSISRKIILSFLMIFLCSYLSLPFLESGLYKEAVQRCGYFVIGFSIFIVLFKSVFCKNIMPKIKNIIIKTDTFFTIVFFLIVLFFISFGLYDMEKINLITAIYVVLIYAFVIVSFLFLVVLYFDDYYINVKYIEITLLDGSCINDIIESKPTYKSIIIKRKNYNNTLYIRQNAVEKVALYKE